MRLRDAHVRVQAVHDHSERRARAAAAGATAAQIDEAEAAQDPASAMID
eukprot:COSAG02_NODE_40533_length_404_cov_0.996721_1_plen_48_part_10